MMGKKENFSNCLLHVGTITVVEQAIKPAVLVNRMDIQKKFFTMRVVSTAPGCPEKLWLPPP